MNDLTAWVELWEIVPELVPPGWVKRRVDDLLGPDVRTHWWWVRDTIMPEHPRPIDIYAQIGKAVGWLQKNSDLGAACFGDADWHGTLLGYLHWHCSAALYASGRLPQSPTA